MRFLWPIVGAAKVNFGWKLGPIIIAPVNHSPARNKKTTTALCSTRVWRQIMWCQSRCDGSLEGIMMWLSVRCNGLACYRTLAEWEWVTFCIIELMISFNLPAIHSILLRKSGVLNSNSLDSTFSWNLFGFVPVLSGRAWNRFKIAECVSLFMFSNLKDKINTNNIIRRTSVTPSIEREVCCNHQRPFR